MRAAAIVLLLGLHVAAQDRPSTQLLTETQALRADNLRGELDQALAAGELATIQAKAADLRALHAGLPAGHWQRKSAEVVATRFEKLAASAADRTAYREAIAALERAAAASQAGKHAEAETLLAQVLTAQQKLFPAPSPDLADTYIKIATANRAANKLPQAIAYAAGAMTMLQQVWGEHPAVARAHLILGDLFDRTDAGDRAETHYRRAWELARHCLGPNSDLAVAGKEILMKNLLGREQARRAAAIERLHLLDELDVGLGVTHADTMAACRTAAEVVEASGDAAAAEPLYRRLVAYRQANNAGPSATAESMQMLVMNLVRQNKTGEVEALARKMLDTQAAAGDDHPGTATAHLVHGEALLALNKVDAALESFNKSLDLRRKQRGPEHPGTIAALNRLAHAYNDLCRPAEAEPHFRKCLDIGVKLAGEQNGNVAALRCNLGLCLRDQGKLDEAETCLTAALRTFSLLEGTPGVSAATALLNLGSVQLARQKYAAALGLFARAHDAVKQSAGESHPLMGQVYADMGGVLLQLGKADQAEVILTQAVALQRKIQGSESGACAVARCDLAECLLRRGKAAEAEKLARQAVSTLEKVAPGSPDLAFAAVTLGKTLDALDKLKEGEASHRQGLTLLQAKNTPTRRLGKVYAALGTNLHKQKRDADAEPVLRQALAALKQEPLTLELERRDLDTVLTETLKALGKSE